MFKAKPARKVVKVSLSRPSRTPSPKTPSRLWFRDARPARPGIGVCGVVAAQAHTPARTAARIVLCVSADRIDNFHARAVN